MKTHLSWKCPQPGQEKPKRLSMALNFSASPLKSKKDLNPEYASLTSQPNLRPIVVLQTSPKRTSYLKSLICEATDVRYLSLIWMKEIGRFI